MREDNRPSAKCLPAYDRTRLRFQDFVAGLDDAITRAKELDPTGSNHTRNPSTSMWRLVSSLLEQK